MVAIMMVTLVAVSLFHARLSRMHAGERMWRQLDNVVDTLSHSSFPLSDAVLSQVAELTETQLVRFDNNQQPVASSLSRESLSDLLGNQPLADVPARTRRAVTVGGRDYYLLSDNLARIGPDAVKSTLWVLCPVDFYVPGWWEVLYPPLLVGAGTLILAIGAALMISARVTQPLQKLQLQIDHLAQGDFAPLPLPLRDDEVRELSQAVNRTAQTLSRYEQEVRLSERYKTLGQLGGGIAHHLRNSATGCRLALDLHRADCRSADDESMRVALQQLSMMETYLRRFLALGQPSEVRRERIDLGRLVSDTVPLVRPFAQHLGVLLESPSAPEPYWVDADPQALHEVLVTLLLNAIEATASLGEGRDLSRPPAGLGASSVDEATSDGSSVASSSVISSSAAGPVVSVELQRAEGGWVRISVFDTGPGPTAEMEGKLFQEFASNKTDGTGLGLASASRIAQAHGGRIEMWRRDGRTEFRIMLPVSGDGACRNG